MVGEKSNISVKPSKALSVLHLTRYSKAKRRTQKAKCKGIFTASQNVGKSL